MAMVNSVATPETNLSMLKKQIDLEKETPSGDMWLVGEASQVLTSFKNLEGTSQQALRVRK